MMRSITLCLCAFVLVADAKSLRSAGGDTFMLVSGVTSKSEQCMVVADQQIGLEPCTAGIAAGDGRELWSLSSGSLSSVSSKQCAGVSDGAVTLTSCDGAAKFEPAANGQLKVGDACLSFSGLAPGKANVAANAAVTASSTNNVAHGAAAAVDDNDASFWASKFDEAGDVTFTINLGSQALSGASIAWEFPAKAFSIAVSGDGEHYTNVYSTDSNVLKTTNVALGGVVAASLKITMSEPGAAGFQGHSVYGIKTVSVNAPQLTAVAGDCGASADGRDKFFLSYVGQFDPFAAKALLSELPSLEAAKASLSATVSELTDVLPKLAACKAKTGLSLLAKEQQLYESSARATVGGAASDAAALVDGQVGIDAGSIDLLVKEARLAIIAARAALK